MKHYKNFIFDWDGTLANTLEIWFNAYIELFSKYGIKASYHEVAEKAYGDPLGSLSFGIKDYRTFNEQLVSLVEKNYETAILYPQIKKTLVHLRNNKDHRIFLFTSTNKKLIMRSLKRKNLTLFFDMIISREDVSSLKPNSQGIEIIINKYHCLREDIIMIGDTDKDILAGKNSKIDTFLFSPPQNKKYYNEKQFDSLNPTYNSQSMLELLNLAS